MFREIFVSFFISIVAKNTIIFTNNRPLPEEKAVENIYINVYNTLVVGHLNLNSVWLTGNTYSSLDIAPWRSYDRSEHQIFKWQRLARKRMGNCCLKCHKRRHRPAVILITQQPIQMKQKKELITNLKKSNGEWCPIWEHISILIYEIKLKICSLRMS